MLQLYPLVTGLLYLNVKPFQSPTPKPEGLKFD
jgi:hypothetical protein